MCVCVSQGHVTVKQKPFTLLTRFLCVMLHSLTHTHTHTHAHMHTHTHTNRLKSCIIVTLTSRNYFVFSCWIRRYTSVHKKDYYVLFVGNIYDDLNVQNCPFVTVEQRLSDLCKVSVKNNVVQMCFEIPFVI